ncbi:MAG: YbaK/EbsC family protein [Firmicutes bacterium]|nr:YbaK/EbsC family protein [Bacillota bacterium]
MSIEKVKRYFAAYGMEDRIREFSVSSATVALAAQAIGCEPKRIVKTLSFDVGGEPILIAAAGDARVDNAKYKARFGVKARMLSHEDAAEKIGHAVGGVCPFAVNEGVKVYLDESIRRFDTVYPAAGSSNSVIKLTVPELERHSHCVDWVDVCKGWQEENGE